MTEDTHPGTAGMRALILLAALALPLGLAILAERAGPAPGLLEDGAQEGGEGRHASDRHGEEHGERDDD
jgi:hypothetical protein